MHMGGGDGGVTGVDRDLMQTGYHIADQTPAYGASDGDRHSNCQQLTAGRG
jgi:hypothetical protein